MSSDKLICNRLNILCKYSLYQPCGIIINIIRLFYFMEIMERVNHIMKEKEEVGKTVTTEDIVSGLYVEMLASDINKVKLNGDKDD